MIQAVIASLICPVLFLLSLVVSLEVGIPGGLSRFWMIGLVM